MEDKLHRARRRTALLAIVALVIGCVAMLLYFRPWQATPINNRPARNAAAPATEKVKTVAENLTTPWSLVFYNDIPIVSSRDTGDIMELATDGKARVIGRVEDAEHRREGGLLGLAVDERNGLYA